MLAELFASVAEAVLSYALDKLDPAEPLDYDYLLQLERDGFDELPVKDGNRLVKVNVRQLLSGIESEAQRKEAGGRVTNIYIGGDVSGNVVAGDENAVENS